MQPVTTKHFTIPLRENRDYNCGPVAIQMAAGYFGCDCTVDKVCQLASADPGKATMTIDLAAAAAQLGFKVSLYTKSLTLDPSHFEAEFYQAAFSSLQHEKEKGDRHVQRCRDLGVGLYERVLSLDELLHQVTRDSVVIVLFDWNVVRGGSGQYCGHYAPVVGYDPHAIAVHNSGCILSTGEVIEAAESGMRIDRQLFDQARLAPGTDADTLVIHRR